MKSIKPKLKIPIVKHDPISYLLAPKIKSLLFYLRKGGFYIGGILTVRI